MRVPFTTTRFPPRLDMGEKIHHQPGVQWLEGPEKVGRNNEKIRSYVIWQRIINRYFGIK